MAMPTNAATRLDLRADGRGLGLGQVDVGHGQPDGGLAGRPELGADRPGGRESGGVDEARPGSCSGAGWAGPPVGTGAGAR